MRSFRTGTWRFVLTLLALLATGCSGSTAPVTISDSTGTPAAVAETSAGAALSAAVEVPNLPAPLQLLHDSAPRAIGEDTIEVWVCQVPLDTTDPTFNVSTLRLDLTPQTLSDAMNAAAAQYFSALSHGVYLPAFVPGGVHRMAATESPEQCVGAALDSADPGSNAVFAVGTAESGATTSGGFGTPGYACASGPIGSCSAVESRRSAYVGASDFHPDWGPQPAMDLVEHEMGHMLGWPHSGTDDGNGYSSGIDVMSNSAAPRGFDPTRRDGQDTLGINRVAAGWIPWADVIIADSSQTVQTPTLEPSTSSSGSRLIILPVDDLRFLTVEYLSQSGWNSFLPEGGIAITMIDQTPTVCASPEASRCTAEHRGQFAQTGPAPFYNLLDPTDPAWTGFGWTVSTTSLGEDAQIQLAR